VKTINPFPHKEGEPTCETVADALTRVLARMLAEDRLKSEFRRLRPDIRSAKRAKKPAFNQRGGVEPP
jgi:hypothetical protein